MSNTRFRPGQSGNPSGKRKGCRNKATLAAQALLDGEAEALTRKCVDFALAGDMQALKLCLERILSARKTAPIKINLPVFKSTSDMPKVTASVVRAVATGKLAPDEAEALSRVFDRYVKALELSDIEQRLTALEKSRGKFLDIATKNAIKLGKPKVKFE